VVGRTASTARPTSGQSWADELSAARRLPFTKLPCKAPPYGGIRAIDLATGKTIWDRPFRMAPMTYAVNGRQYVVLMTGGHHFMETPVGDQVIAWALPAAGTR
jgi:glucose dehydrogenase